MSDETIISTAASVITAVEKNNDLFSQGDLWFWKCEYEKAREHFQAVLNQPSICLVDAARCYNSLGAVNAKLKNYEEALNNYHRQLDLLLKLEASEKKENDIAKCKMSIGKIYWLKQDYARAINCYNKLLAVVPTVTLAPDLTSNIHKDLANLYMKTLKFDLALVHFEKALNIDRHQLEEDHPKFGQTYANMGVMYYSQQDYKQALNYFELARKTWQKSLPSTHVYIESMEKTIRTVQSKLVNFTEIPMNDRWAQNGITIAGGHGQGKATNQLDRPLGLYIDEDQTVYIADQWNDRIVQWKLNATSGEVVAGGKGNGNSLDQLYGPSNVIVDKETDSFIISDRHNRRVMRWSRRSGTESGEIIISNIKCWGLAMDDERFLYVSDEEKHEVKRYKMGETTGIVVAGGNGRGDRLNQLSKPGFVFVDRDYSVYVSDWENHRVMKLVKGTTEGIVVAGGRGQGNALNQLSEPNGLFADASGTVYVAEGGNDRVTVWCKGATQGEIVVGKNGTGNGADQFDIPHGLSFDQHGNLYVVDRFNHRVQHFSIENTKTISFVTPCEEKK